MAMTVTASANQQLDFLLEGVCIPLQLTPTQRQRAEGHYGAIGRWLADPESPLSKYQPVLIHPQGSMLLGTTTKPRSHVEHEEHDLDLVCLLHLDRDAFSPIDVYEMVEARLRENGRYEPLLERYKRCVRVNYKGDFHLDITPGCPDYRRGNDCIWVPDRKVHDWKPSNPKGFAEWFEARTPVTRAIAAYESRADIEPLPDDEPAYQKAPLRRVVQLLKRRRDVRFSGDELAPRSVVLTTLAATHYGGYPGVNDALIDVLDKILLHVRATSGILRVPNPSHPDEDFSEAWKNNPQAYRAFVEYVEEFRRRLGDLLREERLDRIAKKLAELFGEIPTQQAVESYALRFDSSRQAGRLGVIGSAATLSTAPAAITVPRNTFYGRPK